MAFINENFMLENETAKHLYHDFAKDMPIYDYHCHLDPKQISDNVKCDNIAEHNHFQYNIGQVCLLFDSYTQYSLHIALNFE